MEKIKINKITKSQYKYLLKLLEEVATKVDDRYYFIPCWFEKTEDSFYLYHLDGLPKKLSDLLYKTRLSQINDDVLVSKIKYCKTYTDFYDGTKINPHKIDEIGMISNGE